MSIHSLRKGPKRRRASDKGDSTKATVRLLDQTLHFTETMRCHLRYSFRARNCVECAAATTQGLQRHKRGVVIAYFYGFSYESAMDPTGKAPVNGLEHPIPDFATPETPVICRRLDLEPLSPRLPSGRPMTVLDCALLCLGYFCSHHKRHAR